MLRKQMIKCKKLVERNFWVHTTREFHDATVLRQNFLSLANKERKSFQTEDISSDESVGSNSEDDEAYVSFKLLGRLIPNPQMSKSPPVSKKF